MKKRGKRRRRKEEDKMKMGGSETLSYQSSMEMEREKKWVKNNEMMGKWSGR